MLECLPGPWPPLLRPVPAAQRGEGARPAWRRRESPSESPPGSATSLPGRRCPPPLPEVCGGRGAGGPDPRHLRAAGARSSAG